MRAHKLICKIILPSNMRPINVSLDATTWELAKKKSNFSEWVRQQLRSERNKKQIMEDERPWKYCYSCDKRQKTNSLTCMYRNCKDVTIAVLEEVTE